MLRKLLRTMWLAGESWEHRMHRLLMRARRMLIYWVILDFIRSLNYLVMHNYKPNCHRNLIWLLNQLQFIVRNRIKVYFTNQMLWIQRDHSIRLMDFRRHSITSLMWNIDNINIIIFSIISWNTYLRMAHLYVSIPLMLISYPNQLILIPNYTLWHNPGNSPQIYPHSSTGTSILYHFWR